LGRFNTSVSAKSLLLVSYWYPPAVGAAAERIHSFAKYLPEHGWKVQVLTAARGESLLNATPTALTHEIPDPFARNAAAFADYDPRRRPGRLRSWARDLVFPDRFWAWQRLAVQYASRLAVRENVRLILASFPPASAACAGLRLHEATGVPLVLDLRDRWLGPGGYEPKGRRAKSRHRRLEARCIACADGVVTVSRPLAEAIAREHHYPVDRIAVIPNGYDPVDAAATSPDARDSHDNEAGTAFTIAHVGTVIARNRPDLFLQSISELNRRGALPNVTFQFVGNLSKAYIESLGLAGSVHSTGLLPREEARRLMHRADALLLLTGGYVGRWGLSAKLFEYLPTRRPILCLEETSGSLDRKLLEELAPDRAFFAPLAALDEIASAITQLRTAGARRKIETGDNPLALAAFRRDALAAELAGFLDQISA